jgi:glycosyltransferase involved in cell wall biosynthesis
LPCRVGKGGSVVAAGLSAISKNLMAYIDVDLAAGPPELQRLIENIHNYDIVIGSRILRGDLAPIRRPVYRTVFSHLYSKAFRVLFRIPIFDPQCGVKLFRSEVIPKLFSEIDIGGFAFDSEIIVKASTLGLTIKEIPINWNHGKSSTLSVLTEIKSMGLDLLSLWYKSHLLWQQGKLTYPQKKGTLLGKGLFMALSLSGQVKRRHLIYSGYKSLVSNIPIIKGSIHLPEEGEARVKGS